MDTDVNSNSRHCCCGIDSSCVSCTNKIYRNRNEKCSNDSNVCCRKKIRNCSNNDESSDNGNYSDGCCNNKDSYNSNSESSSNSNNNDTSSTNGRSGSDASKSSNKNNSNRRSGNRNHMAAVLVVIVAVVGCCCVMVVETMAMGGETTSSKMSHSEAKFDPAVKKEFAHVRPLGESAVNTGLTRPANRSLNTSGSGNSLTRSKLLSLLGSINLVVNTTERTQNDRIKFLESYMNISGKAKNNSFWLSKSNMNTSGRSQNNSFWVPELKINTSESSQNNIYRLSELRINTSEGASNNNFSVSEPKMNTLKIVKRNVVYLSPNEASDIAHSATEQNNPALSTSPDDENSFSSFVNRTRGSTGIIGKVLGPSEQFLAELKKLENFHANSNPNMEGVKYPSGYVDSANPKNKNNYRGSSNFDNRLPKTPQITSNQGHNSFSDASPRRDLLKISVTRQIPRETNFQKPHNVARTHYPVMSTSNNFSFLYNNFGNRIPSNTSNNNLVTQNFNRNSRNTRTVISAIPKQSIRNNSVSVTYLLPVTRNTFSLSHNPNFPTSRHQNIFVIKNSGEKSPLSAPQAKLEKNQVQQPFDSFPLSNQYTSHAKGILRSNFRGNNTDTSNTIWPNNKYHSKLSSIFTDAEIRGMDRMTSTTTTSPLHFFHHHSKPISMNIDDFSRDFILTDANFNKFDGTTETTNNFGLKTHITNLLPFVDVTSSSGASSGFGTAHQHTGIGVSPFAQTVKSRVNNKAVSSLLVPLPLPLEPRVPTEVTSYPPLISRQPTQSNFDILDNVPSTSWNPFNPNNLNEKFSIVRPGHKNAGSSTSQFLPLNFTTSKPQVTSNSNSIEFPMLHQFNDRFNKNQDISFSENSARIPSSQFSKPISGVTSPSSIRDNLNHSNRGSKIPFVQKPKPQTDPISYPRLNPFKDWPGAFHNRHYFRNKPAPHLLYSSGAEEKTINFQSLSPFDRFISDPLLRNNLQANNELNKADKPTLINSQIIELSNTSLFGRFAHLANKPSLTFLSGDRLNFDHIPSLLPDQIQIINEPHASAKVIPNDVYSVNNLTATQDDGVIHSEYAKEDPGPLPNYSFELQQGDYVHMPFRIDTSFNNKYKHSTYKWIYHKLTGGRRNKMPIGFQYMPYNPNMNNNNVKQNFYMHYNPRVVYPIKPKTKNRLAGIPEIIEQNINKTEGLIVSVPRAFHGGVLLDNKKIIPLNVQEGSSIRYENVHAIVNPITNVIVSLKKNGDLRGVFNHFGNDLLRGKSINNTGNVENGPSEMLKGKNENLRKSIIKNFAVHRDRPTPKPMKYKISHDGTEAETAEYIDSELMAALLNYTEQNDTVTLEHLIDMFENYEEIPDQILSDINDLAETPKTARYVSNKTSDNNYSVDIGHLLDVTIKNFMSDSSDNDTISYQRPRNYSYSSNSKTNRELNQKRNKGYSINNYSDQNFMKPEISPKSFIKLHGGSDYAALFDGHTHLFSDTTESENDSTFKFDHREKLPNGNHDSVSIKLFEDFKIDEHSENDKNSSNYIGNYENASDYFGNNENSSDYFKNYEEPSDYFENKKNGNDPLENLNNHELEVNYDYFSDDTTYVPGDGGGLESTDSSSTTTDSNNKKDLIKQQQTIEEFQGNVNDEVLSDTIYINNNDYEDNSKHKHRIHHQTLAPTFDSETTFIKPTTYRPSKIYNVEKNQESVSNFKLPETSADDHDNPINIDEYELLSDDDENSSNGYSKSINNRAYLTSKEHSFVQFNTEDQGEGILRPEFDVINRDIGDLFSGLEIVTEKPQQDDSLRDINFYFQDHETNSTSNILKRTKITQDELQGAEYVADKHFFRTNRDITTLDNGFKQMVLARTKNSSDHGPLFRESLVNKGDQSWISQRDRSLPLLGISKSSHLPRNDEPPPSYYTLKLPYYSTAGKTYPVLHSDAQSSLPRRDFGVHSPYSVNSYSKQNRYSDYLSSKYPTFMYNIPFYTNKNNLDLRNTYRSWQSRYSTFNYGNYGGLSVLPGAYNDGMGLNYNSRYGYAKIPSSSHSPEYNQYTFHKKSYPGSINSRMAIVPRVINNLGFTDYPRQILPGSRGAVDSSRWSPYRREEESDFNVRSLYRENIPSRSKGFAEKKFPNFGKSFETMLAPDEVVQNGFNVDAIYRENVPSETERFIEKEFIKAGESSETMEECAEVAQNDFNVKAQYRENVSSESQGFIEQEIVKSGESSKNVLEIDDNVQEKHLYVSSGKNNDLKKLFGVREDKYFITAETSAEVPQLFSEDQNSSFLPFSSEQDLERKQIQFSNANSQPDSFINDDSRSYLDDRAQRQIRLNYVHSDVIRRKRTGANSAENKKEDDKEAAIMTVS